MRLSARIPPLALALSAVCLQAQMPRPFGGVPTLADADLTCHVLPRASFLLEGDTRAFRIRPAPGSLDLPAECWRWAVLENGPGHIDADTGLYTAPRVDAPRLVTVRATCRTRPALAAEAECLLLPASPFALVGEVLGADWLACHTASLPFRDPAGGLGPTAVVARPPLRVPPQYGGYGVPFTLRWPATPGSRAQLLSVGEGASEALRRDVTGRVSLRLTLRAHARGFSLEALGRAPDSAAWERVTWEGALHLRGLFPFAGNEVTAPGHRDGPPDQARFQAPFGLVAIEWAHGRHQKPAAWLVSDPEAHLIRTLAEGGEVTTPWGEPGQAAHRDAAPGEEGARFNAPTFLLVRGGTRGEGLAGQGVVVADSGNHCLRLLHRDGAATTLAGRPGEPGHEDRGAGEARFHSPQGLAEDAAGNLYVADQGNRVIRRLGPEGQVTTLAGGPGQAGDLDGLGTGARFTELRGLAILAGPDGREALYAADGHAIRRIGLEDGQVTTVLGDVRTPGFMPAGGPGTPDLRQPCLNQPCGLTPMPGGLLIADRGNHAVRAWRLDPEQLSTPVGDPGLPRTRCGRVRDAPDVPPGDEDAGVEAPRAVAVLESAGPHGADFLVTAGRSVSLVCAALRGRDRLAGFGLETGPATLAEPCAVRFKVEALTPEGAPAIIRTCHFTADFLEPDGTLGERVSGQGLTEQAIRVQGRFSQRGLGKVVVRCVTEEGAAGGAQAAVDIR